MKYSEILQVNASFQPFYDITNERLDSKNWQYFIANKKFYNILNKVTDILTSPDNGPRSIWIQGTYGTGKSHSTGVIKHLLWDDEKDTDDFINNFEDFQVKAKIKKLRKETRVFPVALKGVSNITDNRTFSLVLEKAVKKSLKDKKIVLKTKSDFERMVHHLEKDLIDWNSIIKSHPKLNMYVNNKAKLIDELKKKEDVEKIMVLESILKEEDLHISFSEIDKWLSEVSNELRDKHIADSMMIFWDEFTSMLELERKSEILSQLQDIAELGRDNKVHLYVVSHRRPSQAGLSADDFEKVLDRFVPLDYAMDPVTTYHIINGAILKKDFTKWEETKNKHLDKEPKFKDLINRIAKNESAAVKDEIIKLFPIHPYAAYLATFVARYIGSTDRSIFDFISNTEKGFAKFIDNEIEESPFMTANRIWDFFIDDFERDTSGNFKSVMDKYKSYIDIIENKGDEYLAIFKGLLLLNGLFRMLSSDETKDSLLVPSQENINMMFSGTRYEKEIDKVLNFIDADKIIPKTPSGLFHVAFSSLPPGEIEKEKEKLFNSYKDIVSIININPGAKDNIRSILTNALLRQNELNLYWAGEQQHIIKTRLSKDFTKPYTAHIAVFVLKNDDEKTAIKAFLKQISTDDEFNSIIFVVIDEEFGNDRYLTLIEYLAQSTVARNRNYKEDEINSSNYAKSTVDEWIKQLQISYSSIIFNGTESNHVNNKIGSYLNSNIVIKIFRYGLENIQHLQKGTVWTIAHSRASIEPLLFASNLEDFKERTKSGTNYILRDMLKKQNDVQFIVNDDLDFKPHADDQHPVKFTTTAVEQKLEDIQEHPNFHIGDKLKFLTLPPYGLYPNKANMALMGFVLRKYIGKLYEESTGTPIVKNKMRDIIFDVFKYWSDNKASIKLNLRYGSIEEKEVVDLLRDLFNFDSAESLNDLKWKIREYIKEAKYPIWSLGYVDTNLNNVVDDIFDFTKLQDKEIDANKIKNLLNNVNKYKVDLSMNINPTKLEEGFTIFLNNMGSIQFKDSDLNSVNAYLMENMQEETCFWEKDKVTINVYEWNNKRQTPIEPPGSPIEPPGHPAGPDGPEDSKLQERVKDKIQTFDGDLRKVLSELVDKHLDFARLLDQFLP